MPLPTRTPHMLAAALVALLLASSPGCQYAEQQSKANPPEGTAPMPETTPSETAETAPAKQFTYPQARQENTTDDYHGTTVADPYRWLEDPDSEETRAWVTAENEITNAFLEGIPQRGPLQARLTEVWNYERFGTPTVRGGRYFFLHNDGLQDQSELWVADGLHAEPRLLLDPNSFSDDGTISLAGWDPSDDGKYLAYGTSDGGSDWREWFVVDVATGEKMADHLQWIRNGGISWTPDGTGMYYGRYPAPPGGDTSTAPNRGEQFWYHALGTSQDDDVLIYERPEEPDWGFGGGVSEDGRYLLVYISKGTLPVNQLYVKDLEDPASELVPLFDDFAAGRYIVGNDGPVFYIMTDENAPNWRVAAIDTRLEGPERWSEIVPESEATLDSVSLLGDEFYCQYLVDATTKVLVYTLEGELAREVALPGLGSASGFGGLRDSSETFYGYTDFATPYCIYRYDLASGESTLYREPKVLVDPSDFVTRQVFYTSADGTRIPMFITHKQGIVLDGTNPTILYGYGGFNVSLTPYFSSINSAWLEMGGVYAVANLRGGGEYGRAWHDGGRLANKQNVFDDFIAAGEWLIENKYTSTPKLAIMGGSNGGLLVGAVMNQRPELFGAAIPAVGVMDMLRYHTFTIGWMWADDYGKSDDPEQFATLFSYSPLHNIQQGAAYPATLIMTADHDDRVVPAHSFKYAATLQAAQGGAAPILIRIETRAGHGAGTPTSKQIESAADKLAFLADILEVPVPESWIVAAAEASESNSTESPATDE